MEMFTLTGQSAIVTGGQGRIGPIWVDTLKQAGADVYTFDLPEYDVTDKVSILKFRRELTKQSVVPTILINNAAIDNPPGSDASFWGNIDRILEVNLEGAANMSEAFLPGMIGSGGGVIINIGSIMGNIGADWRNYDLSFEKPVAYNLSKAALVQLSRSITVQYGRYNVRSVTLAFGPFDMGLSDKFKKKFLKNVPLGRPISERSLRSSLLYAIACDELAGTQVLVDGGYVAL